MASKKSRFKFMGVNVRPDQFVSIDIASQKTGVSKSLIVRDALDEYLEKGSGSKHNTRRRNSKELKRFQSQRM